MIVVLEFMFSGILKFIGCFLMFLLLIALIEGIVCNICRTILAIKALKYNSRIDNSHIKNNIRDMITGKE